MIHETNYKMKTDDSGITWVTLQPLIKDVQEVYQNAEKLYLQQHSEQEQKAVMSTIVCTRAVLEFLKSLETEQMVRNMVESNDVDSK